MTLEQFIKKRREELGLRWTDFENAGIHCNTLSNLLNGKQTVIKPVTQEKLALVLKCSRGELQACMAEQNPLKKVIVSKKSLAKQKKAQPEPEPEELPFDDLPEQEPEEGEDMKWFADIPKEEAPTKVKVKVTPELEKVAKENPGTIESNIEKSVEEALEQFQLVTEPNVGEDMNVNHPYHYTQGGIECIEAIKASMSPAEFKGYLKGNVQKYLWRYRLKNGVEDLKKASWYLNRLIKEIAG